MERAVLGNNHYSPAASSRIAAFHSDVVAKVQETVQKEKVVVVGMAWNPHCKKACKNLEQAGIQHSYLEFGSYASAWRERLAIKMWSGWPTFPQVFVNGVLVGGNSDLEAALADGSLKQLLGK